MSEINSAMEIPNVKDLGNVIPEGYTYSKKIFTTGNILILPGAALKWYNLYPAGKEIKSEQVLESTNFIISEINSGRLIFENELGFVILHRAGDYLLLLITTWRNTNEMWESAFAKRVDRVEEYTRFEFKTEHRATYCVWELGAVWHERDAWIRFIQSKRDDEAKLVYLNDTFSGEV